MPCRARYGPVHGGAYLTTPKAHSIQAKLLSYSHAHQENHNHTLSRYAIERLMYRLSKSPHADRFVLKGAMLFVLWLDRVHRPTKDLDLLGLGESSADSLRTIFEEVCTLSVEDDGVEFFKELIAIEEIREAEVYQGLRVRITGSLGGIRLNVSVDVGFGDTIVPRPRKETYPVLLDLPNPKLKTYPRETVVAEKLRCHRRARASQQPHEGLLRSLDHGAPFRIRRHHPDRRHQGYPGAPWTAVANGPVAGPRRCLRPDPKQADTVEGVSPADRAGPAGCRALGGRYRPPRLSFAGTRWHARQ